MAVPYHTHTFEIPAATKEDVVAGVSVDKAVVPASLGTAAVRGIEDFATAAQGTRADSAVQPSRTISAGAGLTGGGTLSANLTFALNSTSLSSLAKADTALQPSRQVVAGLGMAGGGTLNTDITLSLSPETQSSLGRADSAVQPTRKLTPGIGLTGGGDLSADRTVSLNAASQASLAKADSAVQPSRSIIAGTGLTGGGALGSDVTVSLNASSQASLGKADTSIQAPGGAAGQVLAKNSATDNDVAWRTVEGATAVSYGPQTLTAAQKAQGRSNLDALGTVDKGKADGVASLDGSGKVPTAQLPAMNYLPLAGGTLTGPLQLRAAGNKVIRFLREDSTISSSFYGGPDASGGVTLAVNNADNTATSNFGFNIDGSFIAPTRIAAGASGALEGNGNVWGSVWGSNLYTWLTADPGVRIGGRAFPRLANGNAINFNWTGTGGQPAWVFGGSDPTALAVYNPANWSVNYANSAGSAGNANTVGGWDLNGILNRIEDRAYWRTQDYLLAETIPVGGYVLARAGGNETINTGNDRNGSQLAYSNSSASTGGPIGYGSWRNCSSLVTQTASGIFKRIG